jgi:uncharacterized membrane protein YfcA
MNRTSFSIAAIVWLPWLAGMAFTDGWHLFGDYGFMSLVMAVGSFIAGATSEGGGAVAFPAMTLGFGIAPATARDFSLMIQAIGMTAASVAIFSNRIPVVFKALLPAIAGGALGVVVGPEYIAPILPPAFAKMTFASVWLSFAGALWLMNRDHDRAVNLDLSNAPHWAFPVLALGGVVGGIVTSITGSGLDILTFALLVLLFRVSERVATPTSVVLMASNAAVGALWKGTLGAGLAPEAWSYWWVCVPVVVIGAPMGARFIAGKSREFIVGLLSVSIAVQFIAAIFIIPQTPVLMGYAALVFLAGLGAFYLLSRQGRMAVA